MLPRQGWIGAIVVCPRRSVRRADARAFKAHAMEGVETYFPLAFKVQSQYRTTWESIGNFYSRVTVAFVRAEHANVAWRPQQITGRAGEANSAERTNRSAWNDGHRKPDGQSDLIRRWRPWKRSTGPRSLQGTRRTRSRPWHPSEAPFVAANR